MTYLVTLTVEIDAGHRLRRHQGKCWNVHGHHYVFKVVVGSDKLTHDGFVIDFGDLKPLIKEVTDQLDHAFIYEKGDPVGDFIKSCGLKVVELDCPPTAENLAKFIFDHLNKRLKMTGLKLIKVECFETPYASAVYEPQEK